jgi:hypothetical protein
MSSLRLTRALAALALCALPLAGCDASGLGGLLTPGTPAGGGIAITQTNADPSQSSVSPGDKITLSVTANHDYGVFYQWTASDGTLSSTTGNPVVWTAPASSGTRCQINVTASDQTGSNTATFVFNVK